MELKLVTILGARPQFVKAAVVCKAIANHNQRGGSHSTRICETILHTGQHYDRNMSDIFFEDMDIPGAHCHLCVRESSHGAMTGRMLEKIEKILVDERPDAVLIYGDTNSTLAGALAAAKLHIPIAHVEAGLRAYNRKMPEEINRVIVDHVADLLFCPTETAERNLKKEGIVNGVHLVGDVMYDAALMFGKKARETSSILRKLNIAPKSYTLATIHRAENTDVPENLLNILKALEKVPFPVIFPVHPRTRKLMDRLDKGHSTTHGRNPIFIDPVGFVDMVRLEQEARLIFTDSGGVQKEAYFHRVPCITLREETEWVETVNSGWNRLAGADTQRILEAFHKPFDGQPNEAYGDGSAAEKIVEILDRC